MAGSSEGDETSTDPEALAGDAGEELEIRDDDDPMNPAAWVREPNVCGSCIAWRPEPPRPGEDVAAGACKLRPELGRVPATLKKCNIYKPRGQFVYLPDRSSGGARRRRAAAPRVLRRSADGELVATRPPPRAQPAPGPRFEDLDRDEVIEPVDPADEGSTGPRPARPVEVVPRTLDLGGDESGPAVHQALVELLRREHGRSTREIHSKFRTGGKAIARGPNGQAIEVSAERLFGVLDRLRASLDALEDAIKAKPALAEDQEEMVANVRRAHGSFTTFNFLFADREDYFSGKE